MSVVNIDGQDFWLDPLFSNSPLSPGDINVRGGLFNIHPRTKVDSTAFLGSDETISISDTDKKSALFVPARYIRPQVFGFNVIRSDTAEFRSLPYTALYMMLGVGAPPPKPQQGYIYPRRLS